MAWFVHLEVTRCDWNNAKIQFLTHHFHFLNVWTSKFIISKSLTRGSSLPHLLLLAKLIHRFQIFHLWPNSFFSFWLKLIHHFHILYIWPNWFISCKSSTSSTSGSIDPSLPHLLLLAKLIHHFHLFYIWPKLFITSSSSTSD